MYAIRSYYEQWDWIMAVSQDHPLTRREHDVDLQTRDWELSDKDSFLQGFWIDTGSAVSYNFV